MSRPLVKSASKLTQVAGELWTYEEPLRFRGFEIGRRMTVVRLADGSLWVNSPARLSPELKTDLKALGDVRFVVPASKLHGHAEMVPYREQFDSALLFASPGLAGHRRDVQFDRVLGDEPPEAWRDEIDQCVFQGNVFGDELVFFHRSSKTVIVGDLCFNLGSRWPRSSRWMANGLGKRPAFGPTPAFRAAIRNRCAARGSVDRILEWEFERVIPGHGDIVDRDAYAGFDLAFSWL